jgi:hypothetical protein
VDPESDHPFHCQSDDLTRIEESEKVAGAGAICKIAAIVPKPAGFTKKSRYQKNHN